MHLLMSPTLVLPLLPQSLNIVKLNMFFWTNVTRSLSFRQHARAQKRLRVQIAAAPCSSPTCSRHQNQAASSKIEVARTGFAVLVRNDSEICWKMTCEILQGHSAVCALSSVNWKGRVERC